jgi:hypothetical protein
LQYGQNQIFFFDPCQKFLSRKTQTKVTLLFRGDISGHFYKGFFMSTGYCFFGMFLFSTGMMAQALVLPQPD